MCRKHAGYSAVLCLPGVTSTLESCHGFLADMSISIPIGNACSLHVRCANGHGMNDASCKLAHCSLA